MNLYAYSNKAKTDSSAAYILSALIHYIKSLVFCVFFGCVCISLVVHR